MNESIYLADNAVLHRLLKVLSDLGIVNQLQVYQDAMDALEEAAERAKNPELKGVAIGAAAYLLECYVENEPEDDEQPGLFDEPEE